MPIPPTPSPAGTVPAAAESPPTDGVPVPDVSEADVETVFRALCLAGSVRGKSWLAQFMRYLGWVHGRGTAFHPNEIAAAARRLLEAGRATHPEGSGFDVPEAVREAWLAEALTPELAARAWPAWARASALYAAAGARVPAPEYRHIREMVALARLVLHAGLDRAGFDYARVHVLREAASAQVVAQAALTPFAPAQFERIDRPLRDELLSEWLARFDLDVAAWQPLLAWLDDRVTADAAGETRLVRIVVAHRRLHRGDVNGAAQALDGLEGLDVALVSAATLAVRGLWAPAASAFAEATRALGRERKARRGLVPAPLLRWHLLALLAQPDAAAWTQARKLCVAESGARKPSPREGWGLWAHAAAARLGDEPPAPGAFAFAWSPGGARSEALRDCADRLVLAAWIGHEPTGWGEAEVAAVIDALQAAGQRCRADLVRQAAARLGLPAPQRAPAEGPAWPVAYFGPPRDAWRDALAAIAALGDSRPRDTEGAAAGTLVWQLTVDEAGRVTAVEAFERAAGARRPGRPRPVTLSRVKKSARLDPRDAAVARCIGPTWYGGSALGIDVAGAAMALVDHPAVTFADDPERTVELRETLPELEVRHVQGDDGPASFEFHLVDPIGSVGPPELGERWTARQPADEVERRNSIRIVREGPDRARLIRITPAQRRVAELVSQRWAVPGDARTELDAALRVLAGHFEVHSDAAAGRAVPGESRLRAQWVPRGDALQLRLVVRPFGDFGPTLQPGRGRKRLLAARDGLQLSTARDLEAESAHLGQVIDALPFLVDADAGDASWLLEDPEQALVALEVLPKLPAVVALDWPRGRPMRVTPLAPAGVRVSVSSSRDWLSVDGEVRVDETRVIGLRRLLDLLRESRRGRFVALGDGEYLALTERLRTQLADLQALAGAGAREAGEGAPLRLPSAAAAFLAEALDGVAIQADARWAERLARLDEAATLEPAVPAALQATLRDYQVEGFAWMSRLAHAGLGAILADDMGLGKTVQTLALLLSRASLGPALVIAPTSVCANWSAEVARFAPGLRVRRFGEGDRAEMLEGAGPGDLVIASYGLALIEGEAFAAREWATLVLDEAHVLKNAAAKRTRAIAALKAGFRLALSGTPVENRLADLWSVMNLLNPGLLGSASQFGERFVAPIERRRDEAVRARLRRLVSPFLLRRTKAQVLADLPPRTEIVHRIEPGESERALLEALRRDAVARVAQLPAGDRQASFHVLAELTRLRRAACDPRLVAPEAGIVGAKAQEFEQLALELVAGRHKALVFSQFTDFLELLAERLRAAGVTHQVLTGATPAAERARRVAAFQAGDGDLFLISLKAGGFGLNLTAADYVIIADPWWNPAAEDQASGRAHRIGQQRPVTVYRLVTAGSIEERIVALHRDKRDLADSIVDGQDQGGAIGADALRELLRG